MFVNSDFSDLLQIFNAREVKYLVIGGYAVVQYAEPRFTKDLDILKVIFISKQDLIASKRAAGRPQDLLDVDLLS